MYELNDWWGEEMGKINTMKRFQPAEQILLNLSYGRNLAM